MTQTSGFSREGDVVQLSAKAHGKVNLLLGVGQARADGYHELTTVFQSLTLADEVTVSFDQSTPVLPGATAVRMLSVVGPGSEEVPVDDANLAWKAADLAVAAARDMGLNTWPTLSLSISKGIPVAGGMAGGSADAAAVLLLVQRYAAQRGYQIGEAHLKELALEIGSDVPFCLSGGTMLGRGRGEQLIPMISRHTYHWALAFASSGLSTKAVFHHLDQLRAAAPAGGAAAPAGLQPITATEELTTALVSGDPHQVARQMANNLQPAALSLKPQLRATLAAGQQAGALRGIVSGSGPTCAFLCASEEDAQAVAEGLLDSGTCTHAVAAASYPTGIDIN